MTIDGHTIRAAADLCIDFLTDSVDTDWSVAVPDLELTVAGVVAHMAETCLWYAIDLAAGGIDLQAVEHRVKTDGSNEGLIQTLRADASIVASVVETSPEATRGFHPMGNADPSGFAAMACDEMLIHTHDTARALGRAFRPPDALARTVLARLFPWVTPSGDVWDQLRWANGRMALDGQPRLSGWAWHCAPLDEWNGTIPTRPT